MGLRVDVIPDRLLGGLPPERSALNGDRSGMEGEFLTDFLKQWNGEILLHLRVSSSASSGLPNFSVHGVFSGDQAQSP
jgi:hypothetical protein